MSFVHDLRVALRSLAKSPGFTTIVLLTLAIGVGANTAVFRIVHGLLLEPLSFPEADRLVVLWELTPDDTGGLRKSRATAGNFRDWDERGTTFSGMAMFGSSASSWTGVGDPEQLLGARVSADYFSVLGVRPAAGRFFAEEESRPGGDRVVVLGHGLWQSRFGSAPDAIGSTMTLDGDPYEVIGVAPPGVYPTWPQSSGRMPLLPTYQQYFVPMRLSEERAADRRSHVFGVIARIAPAKRLDEARAEMETVASQLEAAYPRANDQARVLLQPYVDELYGGSRRGLLVLLAAVGVVLLIACVNLAGLFLARSRARQGDVAVRRALGATRLRVLREMLSESLLLGWAAAALAVAFAAGALRVLVRLSPEEIPRLASLSLDSTATAFAIGLATAAAVFVGAPPAWSAATSSGSLDPRRARSRRLGAGLAVVEVALSVVLVTSAALLLQSYWRLRQVDPGFRHDAVLSADLQLPSARYAYGPATSRFFVRLQQSLQALPSVHSAAVAYDSPLTSNWIDSFRIAGELPTEESLAATLRIASPSYFRTVGLDVVSGRAFTEDDDMGRPGAAIVNEAFVARYLTGRPSLGRVLETTTPHAIDERMPERFEIVGVVRNVKFLGPDTPDEPAFYLPARQFPVGDMTLLVRPTAGEPLALASAVRSAVWELDPNLPLGNLTTLSRLSTEATAAPRFNALLLGAFGAAALVLAALGIYGVLSHDVSRRTREIGIRMAIGARASSVLALVLRQSTTWAVIGVALGAVGSVLTTRLLASLLYGIEPGDALTLAAVSGLLLATSLAASYVPARRASRLAPTVALRHD